MPPSSSRFPGSPGPPSIDGPGAPGLAEEPTLASVEGVLDRVVFENPENGWSVVRLLVEGEQGPVTAVGALPGVQPGERLRLSGEWVEDPKYGRQFRLETFLPIRPSTARAIRKYLGSGLVKGVGPKMAERLVDAFGTETLEVIESEPERLREVPGIGAKRAVAIQEAFVSQRAVRDVMLFLQGHDVPPHLAVKIHRRYGNAALALIRTDPWRLARDIHGIGFPTADAIAARLGIEPTEPRRIQAGVLHLLGEAASGGHVYLPEEEITPRTAEMLQVDEDAVTRALETLAREGAAEVEPGEEAGQRRVYLPTLHGAETGLAEGLLALLAAGPEPVEIDVERALTWFEERESIELAEQQREAIRQAVGSSVLVITGGPGTGKTTLVRGIVEILSRKSRRIRLAAPTGRAAKRLAEATSREASTLHRLLEFDPRKGGFARGVDRPLDGDLVIVDEASMLDVNLAHSLVQAVPEGAQLVLVGDVDQLPSVGPGRVLADLIDSGAVPVVRLEAIFRQAAESRIVTNAHRVNHGEMPLWEGAEDFFFIRRGDPEAALATLVEVVGHRLPQSFGLDPLQDIQVLCPMNRGQLGVRTVNEALQRALNPHGRPVEGSGGLRVGDKVMQVRNNYDLDLFNGDLGRIEGLGTNPDEETIRCRFDDRPVDYPEADLDEMVLAYACSIHKSQGSEYPAVVLPIHTQHYVMLERNLLYTALTRARRLVVLIGTERALRLAVSNRRTRQRFTRLGARLGEGIRSSAQGPSGPPPRPQETAR